MPTRAFVLLERSSAHLSASRVSAYVPLQANTAHNMESHLYSEMAELETKHWWFLGRRAIILDTLQRFSKRKGALLDVGLGTGLNASFFSNIGFAVEGVETSPEAIAIAKEKVPHLRIVQASFPSPAIPSSRYEVITMLDVLEHFEDDVAALSAAHEALAPGGILLITTPAFMFLWSGHDELAHHYRRYRKKELIKKLKDAHLEPYLVSYFNFFLFLPIALVRFITNRAGIKKTASDFSSTPKFINWPLAKFFGAERFLLRFFALPVGVSLLVVARKPPR